jgi:hypothetical protein
MNYWYFDHLSKKNFCELNPDFWDHHFVEHLRLFFQYRQINSEGNCDLLTMILMPFQLEIWVNSNREMDIFVCRLVLSKDLPFSIHCVPTRNSVTPLQNSRSAMSLPLFDRRAEADAGQHVAWAIARPIDADGTPVAWYRHLARVLVHLAK